jgi:hypothetical protein
MWLSGYTFDMHAICRECQICIQTTRYICPACTWLSGYMSDMHDICRLCQICIQTTRYMQRFVWTMKQIDGYMSGWYDTYQESVIRVKKTRHVSVFSTRGRVSDTYRVILGRHTRTRTDCGQKRRSMAEHITNQCGVYTAIPPNTRYETARVSVQRAIRV